MVEARIKTLVESLMFILPGEATVEFAEKHPNDYDLAAYKKVVNGTCEKKYEQKFLDLPDEVMKSKHVNVAELIKGYSSYIEALKVARNYAYCIHVDPNENKLKVFYSSSIGYYTRFDELVEHCKQFTKSLNDMLWDTLQHIIYAEKEAEIEEIRKKIYAFYRNIKPKYLDIVVSDDVIEIYAPKQLMGRVIGKQGANVKKLEEWLGKKVKVYEHGLLSDIYADENPEIPQDPEILKLLSEAIKVIGELEKKGVTIKQIVRYYKESLEGGEREW